ncbi:hypothetical protein AA13595_2877 [Gluconacetobacter johannae DSM 13595]|uniref:Uncharacterized protein n=1 Tax=Gluconacetobacter johannae TaxID=112140 RepID=A0A7W4J9R9_9PROT|nr:hypothetical protein [Gluconacetobacter johannae]MBB2177295.1 hypothetical protein [Gluconacetobacter johannae]GBQ90378.1 hypothetical protein AA13595_2877 [Gluconacetobacter johannae DSM 13595]
MTQVSISQLPDGATVQGSDLLLVSRPAGAGWASFRANISYFLGWLVGQDVVVRSLAGDISAASLSATMTGGQAATAIAAGAAQAAAAVPKASVGAANGVAALDARGGLVLNAGSVMHVDGAGNLILDVPLPTSDPGVANAVWTQGGVLLLSQGPAS